MLSSAAMATSLQWHPLHHQMHHHRPKLTFQRSSSSLCRPASVRAFRRSDLDGFARRMASGEALRDAWRSANDGLELLRFEAKKAAERLDRRYAVSRSLSAFSRAAADYAHDIDRDLEIGRRWRTFSLDFSRNWPRYRRQLGDFFDAPVGRSFSTIFFLWFALSGWMFRCLIFATWVLPLAGPLLIGAVANNMVIKGTCPACKRQFVGYKNQIVTCTGCGNIVWQPKPNGDFFSKSSRGNSSSRSQPDIIDVEFEEK